MREQLKLEDLGKPTNYQKKRINSCHNLMELLCDLEDISTIYGFEVPEIITNLVNEQSQFEITQTWSRYSFSNKKGKHIKHTKEEVKVPIFKIQERLEKTISVCVYDIDKDNNDEAFETQLYCEWERLAREAGTIG